MNKFAVLIGNSQFPHEADKNKLSDLACPIKDVDGLGKVLASERGEFEVLPLKNKTSDQIKRELHRTVNKALQDDLLLLYYSGHGKPNKVGILHLTTYDTVIALLETTAIPINHIYDILDTGKCKKIVIILDCCFSGAAGKGFKGAVDDTLQQLNNGRGTYLVTASTELQLAHENATEGYSLFTKHLIAGLETGDADKDGDGWVSMNELYDYVHSKVIAENSKQQPTKHVKEERGGLFIARSGRNSETERLKKIKHYFHDLAKEERITTDILTGVLELLKSSQPELSPIAQQQYKLVMELFEYKIMAVEFVRTWDKFAFEIEKAKQKKAAIAKVAQEEVARDKAEQDKAAREKVSQEKAIRDKAEQDKAAREKVVQEKAIRDKATQELAVKRKTKLTMLKHKKLEQVKLKQQEKVEQPAWLFVLVSAIVTIFLLYSYREQQPLLGTKWYCISYDPPFECKFNK